MIDSVECYSVFFVSVKNIDFSSGKSKIWLILQLKPIIAEFQNIFNKTIEKWLKK